MPYLKKTYFAGKTIEVEKCYTNRYGKKGQKRRDKVKPTSEQQKEINKRNAEKMLRLLLNANFVGGCKCQYKNDQKVENKNVHFPRSIPQLVFP